MITCNTFDAYFRLNSMEVTVNATSQSLDIINIKAFLYVKNI